jgi:two-component system sensor histidine kinase MprB
VLLDADRLPAADDEALRRDLLQELDSLTALIGDVVDLAREPDREPLVDDVPLHVIIADAVDSARRRSPQIRFTAELAPAWVRGDAPRISRAVVNAIDNAAKWTSAGSCVTVRLEAEVLCVRDHGPGFSERDLPFVFDRFYRADAARRMPGSGLGLAIVRQAAEAHGGWARARNAQGGGAEVRISFGHLVAPPPELAAAPRGGAPAAA